MAPPLYRLIVVCSKPARLAFHKWRAPLLCRRLVDAVRVHASCIDYPWCSGRQCFRNHRVGRALRALAPCSPLLAVCNVKLLPDGVADLDVGRVGDSSCLFICRSRPQPNAGGMFDSCWTRAPHSGSHVDCIFRANLRAICGGRRSISSLGGAFGFS